MPATAYTVAPSAPPESSVAAGHVPGRFYAPELDALRFLAFLLVFCRHISNALGNAKLRVELSATGQVAGQVASQALVPGAGNQVVPPHLSPLWSLVQGAVQSLDFGVCLFFFLSSFLITRLLLIEKKATGTVAIRDFYARRSLRIWPLYFLFLALIACLSPFVPVLHVSASRLWVAALFVANWAAVLHGWQGLAIQPLWSVSVEEQFYLLWPNFARFGRSAIIAISSLLALLSLGTLFYLGHRVGTEVTAIWPNTLVQCLFLAGGALTACLSTPETRRLRIGTRAAMLAGGFLLWLVAGAGFHVARTESPGSFDLIVGYLLVLAGTYLIFTSVAGWNGRPIPRWLLYLGKISYGLYVFHVACRVLSEQAVTSAFDRFHAGQVSPYMIEGLSAVLALVLTLICASLSYKYIEKPFLKLKKHFTVVASRPV